MASNELDAIRAAINELSNMVQSGSLERAQIADLTKALQDRVNRFERMLNGEPTLGLVGLRDQIARIEKERSALAQAVEAMAQAEQIRAAKQDGIMLALKFVGGAAGAGLVTQLVQLFGIIQP